jgi:hypothetical protein
MSTVSVLAAKTTASPIKTSKRRKTSNGSRPLRANRKLPKVSIFHFNNEFAPNATNPFGELSSEQRHQLRIEVIGSIIARRLLGVPMVPTSLKKGERS